MQKNVMNSFIAVENKMARLKQKTLKLSREEYLKNQSAEDECLEITMEKVTCPKCRGDGNESTTVHIQDLCPADRKKITELISELARCTQEKHKVTDDLAVSRAENEALRDKLQLFNSEQEDEKNKLRSQLSNTRTEMSKLRLQTSHSLKLLTQQIIALENQSSKLIETVKDLLSDKISLQDELIKQKIKVQTLEAKVNRMKDCQDVERMLLSDRQMKNQTSIKIDKDCQTETEANSSQDIFTCSRSNTLESIPETQYRFSKNSHVKSKYDLDEPSSEAILIRELFFKRPSIDDNEGLDLFPKLPRS